MDGIRNLLVLLLATILTACSSPPPAETVFPQASQSCESAKIEGQFIVRWKSGRRTLERGQDRKHFIRTFVESNIDEIEHVEFNRRIQLQSPTRPPVGTLMANNWGVERVQAADFWTNNIRGDGVTIAVIDSGVDVTHPQLINQVAYNKGETGLDDQGNDKSTNGIDDDGNGLIDDYAGYDFFANQPQVFDYGSHGTHVAGVIVAAHSDSVAGPQSYVQGIAPEAKIIPIAFIGSDGGGTLFDAIRSIEYAALRGADLINASWGGAECSPELRKTIETVGAQGVLFVAASGNRGLDIDRFAEFPAAFNLSTQITVGSVGTSDLMANHSNYGQTAVHIFAPGVDIFSTVPQNGIESMTGTSMATPFVAGAIALLKSHRPSAGVEHIRQALYLSSVKRSVYPNASQGRLDLATARSELERLVP